MPCKFSQATDFFFFLSFFLSAALRLFWVLLGLVGLGWRCAYRAKELVETGGDKPTAGRLEAERKTATSRQSCSCGEEQRNKEAKKEKKQDGVD